MISKVLISQEAYAYLDKHHIVEPFMKSVSKLKCGNNTGLDFKKRKPKSLNIWSFRITKKYRAYARRKGSVITVYAIDDHQ